MNHWPCLLDFQLPAATSAAKRVLHQPLTTWQFDDDGGGKMSQTERGRFRNSNMIWWVLVRVSQKASKREILTVESGKE